MSRWPGSRDPTDRSSSVGCKSTLNGLELVGQSERYHGISYSAEAIDQLVNTPGRAGDIYCSE